MDPTDGQETALSAFTRTACVQLPAKMTQVTVHALVTKKASIHTRVGPSARASRLPVNGMQHKVARTERAYSWNHRRHQSDEKLIAAVPFAKCKIHMNAESADEELNLTGTPPRPGACPVLRRAASDDGGTLTSRGMNVPAAREQRDTAMDIGTAIPDVRDTATGKARPQRRPSTQIVTEKRGAL